MACLRLVDSVAHHDMTDASEMEKSCSAFFPFLLANLYHALVHRERHHFFFSKINFHLKCVSNWKLHVLQRRSPLAPHKMCTRHLVFSMNHESWSMCPVPCVFFLSSAVYFVKWTREKKTEPNDHLISILIGYKSLAESLAYLNDVHSHTHTNTLMPMRSYVHWWDRWPFGGLVAVANRNGGYGGCV